MAKPVQVTAVAIDEGIAAYLYYFGENEVAAARFEAELAESLHRVGQLPLSFPLYMLGTRRCLFKKFPYMLVFVDTPDTVRVIAIADGRREPGYWRGRLS